LFIFWKLRFGKQLYQIEKGSIMNHFPNTSILTRKKEIKYHLVVIIYQIKPSQTTLPSVLLTLNSQKH
jgi:hypothetical protein